MLDIKLFETVFERIPTATALVDNTGKIVLCTSKARELFSQYQTRTKDQNINAIFESDEVWGQLKEAGPDSPSSWFLKDSLEIFTLHVEAMDEDGSNYMVHFQPSISDLQNPSVDRSRTELVLLIKNNGVVLDASKWSANLVGYDSSELKGSKFQDYLSDDFKLKLSTKLNTQLADGPILSSEKFQLKTKDGKLLWFEGEFERILDRKGKPAYLIGSLRDISELVEAELKNREMRKRFIEVYESIDEGIVYQDENGAITEANNAAQAILGLSLDQMQGRTSMHPEWKAVREDGSDYPGDQHPAMRALQTGRIIKNNIMGVYHPDKRSHVWIKINSYPLFDKGNKRPAAVYTTFVNITNEYNSTKAIERKEFLFRTLFDNAFQFIGLLNPDGTMIDANKTGLQFMGMNKDEVIGAHLWNTPDGVMSDRVRNDMQEGIMQAASGKFVRFDFELKGADGNKITLDFSLRPIFNDEGEVIMLIPEGRDITEKKELEHNLSESNALLFSIVESVPTALFYTSDKGKILRVNSKTSELFGYSEDELMQMSILDVLSNPKLVTKHINSSEVKPFKAEKVGVKKDGRTFPIQLVASTVTQGDGEIMNRLFTIEDISELQAAERLRNEFTKALEHKVLERTEELEGAKKDLEKALEVEKELNHLQAHFVMSASHQFRTPLSIIQSNAEIMEQLAEMIEGAPKEKFKTYSNRITEQIKRTVNLMDDILLLGKITSGAISPTYEEVDLETCLQRLVDQQKDTVADGRLSIELAGPKRRVMTDKKLLEESINNLLSNAIKYSSDTVYIKVNFNDDHYTIEVSDHGIGIDKKDQKNLFQPFFRSNDAIEYSGTGLGLSIAKEYVEAQGGSISLSSSKGKGTTFTLRFNYE